MNIDKTIILKNICYTELVYGRINKKLGRQLSKPEIEATIFTVKELNKLAIEKLFFSTGRLNKSAVPPEPIEISLLSAFLSFVGATY